MKIGHYEAGVPWGPCHPDEIAIPTYFVSYEALVLVGFTKIKAMELWESYKKENDAADESVPDDNKAVLHQNTFRILRHAQDMPPPFATFKMLGSITALRMSASDRV